MKTQRKTIKIKDVFEGFYDKDEGGEKGYGGAWGYGGRLNIRPAYQRELVYDEKEERKVIDSVLKGYPINIMYWVKNQNGDFELLDGQQRTLSICNFLDHKYSITDEEGNRRYEDSIYEEERKQILNYDLDICICEGTTKEILEWFKTINIKGKELNQQEMLNATHTGEWLTDAKRYFSKPNCAAYGKGKDYINGSVERQDFLGTVLDWISDGNIQEYMENHRNDSDASVLWEYYQNVIDWIRANFLAPYKEMKGLPWGKYYNKYNNLILDPVAIANEVNELMADEEVENKKGIFEFVLEEFYRADNGEEMTNGDCEKFLHIRQFDTSIRRSKYTQQNGICPLCNKHFDLEQMHADHIVPWSKGGKTTIDNCQMLCANCNLKKSNQ